MQKQIKQFHFDIKKQSVIMTHNHQVVCFHAFNNPNKRQVASFADSIVASRDMNINRVFQLAREHKVNSMSLPSNFGGRVGGIRLGW